MSKYIYDERVKEFISNNLISLRQLEDLSISNDRFFRWCKKNRTKEPLLILLMSFAKSKRTKYIRFDNTIIIEKHGSLTMMGSALFSFGYCYNSDTNSLEKLF